MDKVALVTGAYKGLGYEWCRQLSKRGYTVILTARAFEQAEGAAEALHSMGGEVYPQTLDVVDSESVKALVAWTKEKFGKLDLLINNAGVNSKTRAKGDKDLQLANLTIEHLSRKEVTDMIDINAISPILLAHAFRPLLQLSESPLIVNISSWLSSISIKLNGGNYGYAVSKSALNMMNRAFAFDVKEENIISVVVNPGWVQTDMGGERASFTVEESVSNLIQNVVEKVSIEDTGNFFNYDGTIHPW